MFFSTGSCLPSCCTIAQLWNILDLSSSAALHHIEASGHKKRHLDHHVIMAGLWMRGSVWSRVCGTVASSSSVTRRVLPKIAYVIYEEAVMI